MLTVEESPHALVVRDELTVLGRVALFAVGCFPWLAPWDLLWKPRWRWEEGVLLNPFFLVSALISAGAVAVGLAFWVGALAGRTTSTTFDLVSRTVEHSGRSPLSVFRGRTVPFAAVAEISLERKEGDEGPDTWECSLVLIDQERLRVARSHDEARSRALVRRLHEVLGRGTRVPVGTEPVPSPTG